MSKAAKKPRRVFVVIQNNNGAAVDVFNERSGAAKLNRYYTSEGPDPASSSSSR